MMRLLSINNYHYRRAGAEAVYFDHNRLFEQQGWQVAHFAMQHTKNVQSDWSGYFPPEIEFAHMQGMTNKLRHAPAIIWSSAARDGMRRLLDQFQPNIAHGHNIYHHLSPAILPILAEREIPTVLTLHDLKLLCPAYKMLTHDGICERCRGGRIWNVARHRCLKNQGTLSSLIFIETLIHRLLRLYHYVDRFVVPSRFYLEKCVEWGWPRERFVHIANGIDPAHYQPDPTAGRAFVFVGRFAPEKGLITLVKAAAQAKVPLRLIGAGELQKELQLLATQLGAEVEFTGFLSGEALHRAIRSGRALILPSEWYENAPISILEAYALGKPVIGADIGGIPEMIRPGQTGWLFPAGDADALAYLLASVAGMADAAVAQIGETGRSWIKQEFSMQQYLNRMVEMYTDMERRA